jgi:ABC-2 type transport system ATP-binding protein
MIEVTNLTYEYPNRKALDNVSFKIPTGSITALVGPNGAGKTTLLRCLAALTKPFSGSITVHGVDIIEHPKECHKSIGFLQDFIGLYSGLTVKQSLTYFGMAYNVPDEELEQKVISLTQKLNLEDKINEKIGSLSRGMRQRLAIGQSIIHNPPLLLLDEPASGLDPEARHSLSQLFLELNAQGMTILVSSHILSELDEYANNLIILRDGKITDANETRVNESARQVSLALAQEFTNLVEILSKIPQVQNIQLENNKVHFKFTGDDMDQHQLLKQLILFNVPVNEFYVKKNNLQDQYLDFIKK